MVVIKPKRDLRFKVAEYAPRVGSVVVTDNNWDGMQYAGGTLRVLGAKGKVRCVHGLTHAMRSFCLDEVLLFDRNDPTYSPPSNNTGSGCYGSWTINKGRWDYYERGVASFSDDSELKVNTRIVDMKKNAFTLEIKREEGVTLFSFVVDPAVEDFFKKQSNGEQKSESWPRLSFYKVNALHDDTTYKETLAEHNLFDDFGNGLYDNKKMNIAWMRTVGGKGTIKFEQNVSFAELSELMKGAVSFLKTYIGGYIKPFNISAKVEMEV